ncbi:MAG TPA: hypothetical protein VHC69_22165 [Polyangiaceae bacterium]|nr:hypothetical protein [Polyangiaceae bacterium]
MKEIFRDIGFDLDTDLDGEGRRFSLNTFRRLVKVAVEAQAHVRGRGKKKPQRKWDALNALLAVAGLDEATGDDLRRSVGRARDAMRRDYERVHGNAVGASKSSTKK